MSAIKLVVVPNTGAILYSNTGRAILRGANAAAKFRRLLDDQGYGECGSASTSTGSVYYYRRSAYVSRHPWGA